VRTCLVCARCTAAKLVDVRRETKEQTVPSGMLIWRSLRCAQALPQPLELLVDVKKSKEKKQKSKKIKKLQCRLAML
jgi:hypothetical protein